MTCTARYLGFCFVTLVAAASSAVASPRPDGSQFGRQSVLRPTVSTQRVQQILTNIRTEGAALRRVVQQSLPRGAATGNPRVAQSETTLYLIDDVVQATDELGDRVTRDQVAREDVDDLLRHAADLDADVRTGPSAAGVAPAWMRMRRALDELASAYNIRWDWRSPQYGTQSAQDFSQPFTGTYRLSPADSDDPRVVSERSLRSLSAADRTRISRQIENRLTPPEVLSIERRGNRITMASSQGPETSFDADGQSHSETARSGRVVTTRAVAHYDEVEVTTTGSGGSDFSVTFQTLNDGRTLSVTRRLYNEALRDPVVMRSLYHRTSEVADWNVYAGNASRSTNRSRTSAILVPTGTTFVGVLEQPLNLKTAREGDRIRLRVESGNEFADATIEGYLTSEPSRASNRTGVSIAFDRITLRDGRSGDFDGTIQSVRDPNGKDIPFSEVERADKGDRTNEAVQHGAIGAALGAVIGAVIGGGKGAAIGAAVGAAGGAGTVLIDNPNQTELPRGTAFTIRSETTDIR